jgi:hypothetical protein
VDSLPDTSDWSRKISVWEILTHGKTERSYMTYILPTDALGGKIIEHSQLMEYDATRLVESYDAEDDMLPPPTPDLTRQPTNYSRPEDTELLPPGSVEKYLFIDGVLKINQSYRNEVLGATFPQPYPQQPLALLCCIEDVELAFAAQCQSTGYQLQLSPYSIESIDTFQDLSYCRELGLLEQELPTNLDHLMSLFNQLEIPLGCLHKIKALKNYHLYFLIDDSYSMITSTSPYLASSHAHEILLSRRTISDSEYLTYWEYCESLLHNFMDILCFVPMKSVRISFVNEIHCGIRLDREEKKIKPKRFQEKFRQKISKSFEKVRLRCLQPSQGSEDIPPGPLATAASAPALPVPSAAPSPGDETGGGAAGSVRGHSELRLYETMEKILAAAVHTSSDPTLFIVLSSGELTDRSPADLKALISQRPSPEKLPISFLPIGDPAKCSWMRGVSLSLPLSPYRCSLPLQIDHQASFVAEVKEYEAEKEEVGDSQGEAFPYTTGVWLISQLVSAINPSDLDLLDEGYPLTKYSLDNLLGRIHTPQVRYLCDY